MNTIYKDLPYKSVELLPGILKKGRIEPQISFKPEYGKSVEKSLL